MIDQGAKYILSDPDKIQIERDADSYILYLGLATPGVGTAEAKWQISKIERDAQKRIISLKYAGGSNAYDKVWDNRATYTYN